MGMEQEERIARQQELEEAHKAGIEEVVEWMNSHSGQVTLKVEHLDGMITHQSDICRSFYEVEWQAQLKKWGIEESRGEMKRQNS